MDRRKDCLACQVFRNKNVIQALVAATVEIGITVSRIMLLHKINQFITRQCFSRFGKFKIIEITSQHKLKVRILSQPFLNKAI